MINKKTEIMKAIRTMDENPQKKVVVVSTEAKRNHIKTKKKILKTGKEEIIL